MNNNKRCMTEALLRDIQEYRGLSDRVRSMFGDGATLKDVVDTLERKVLEPEKPDPVNARILTYEESDIWDAYRAIGTPEQCREAVERTRWIPVSERLPEEEGRYLVTFRSERKAYLVGYGNCQMSVCGKKIGYGWYDLHDAVYFDKKSIVAWKPLSEPYHVAEESNGQSRASKQSGYFAAVSRQRNDVYKTKRGKKNRNEQ